MFAANVTAPSKACSGGSLLGKSGIIIPTYNAARYLPVLTHALQQQAVHSDQILFVDSSSEDETASLVRKAGYALCQIERSEFRHGRTRAQASAYFPQASFLIYLTQDALPVHKDSFSRLLSVFEDEKIGAAYGRQTARPFAGPIERHARIFNYPPTSETRDFDTRIAKGFRAAFPSNSFAAYRRSAMEEAGGFPDTIVSEEVSLVARMLLAGWRTAYVADAEVIHSHDLRLSQEFSRYFDIGVHHQMERWIIEKFGPVSGEGLRFVRSEFRYLLNENPWLIPRAILHNFLKFSGYWSGLHFETLPLFVSKAVSGQPAFWMDEPFANKVDLVERAETVVQSGPNRNSEESALLHHGVGNPVV